MTGSAAVTCGRCGAVEPELPVTWTASVERQGEQKRTVYYCERCSRDNLRSIEGRLDADWW